MPITGDFVNLVCACGKKLRVSANAHASARKGKCPRCNTPFYFREGQWTCATAESSDTQGDLGEGKTEKSTCDALGSIDGYSSSRDTASTRPQTHAPAVVPIERQARDDGVRENKTPEQNESSEGEGHVDLTAQEGSGSSADYLQSKIRLTIERTLQLNQRYGPERASAIALACHPWPDGTVSESILDAISAEMLPGFNLRHPSLDEIAADRLLRIAETLSFENAGELVVPFTEAARLLTGDLDPDSTDRDVFVQHVPYQALIASPWGLSRSSGDQQESDEVLPAHDLPEREKWQSLIHGLLGGVFQHETRDIGVICGGDFAGVSVDELAEHLGIELPEKAFDTYLSGLSSRKRYILQSRSYKLRNPETLVEVASQWAITRERVRQIETRTTEQLRKHFTEVFSEVGRQALTPFMTRVAKTTELHGVALALSGHSNYRETLAAFLLELFGPWKTNGDWSIHSSIVDNVVTLRDRLVADADQYGFVDEARVDSICEHLFFESEERDKYLIEVAGLGYSFGNWMTKTSLRYQVASAIRKIGRPATKEELADLLGHPKERIGSILGSMEGIVRADRYRWGFAEWIDDVYEGIVGEIEQRIDAYNGSVPVRILLREIPSQFNVAEGSVRAYLASDAFVVENDMVRRATDHEYDAKSPTTCNDAVRVGDSWAHRTKVYDRHFNGYSLGVNFDIAFANGVRPGDELLVPIEGCDYEVSLIWRTHNLNRLVDVGRISDYLLSHGYQPGDVVLILPSRESVRLIRESEHRRLGAETSGPEDVTDTDDPDGEDSFSDPLLDLLGDV